MFVDKNIESYIISKIIVSYSNIHIIQYKILKI